MPRSVSVLLPVYRDEPFLSEALSSLEGQTFDDFEVVAVTESLSEGTAAALDASGLPIDRVEYDGGGGLAGALNAGLERCAGDYVARMDADDVALPHRLERQVEFLEAHPGVGVVGSRYRRIDRDGRYHRCTDVMRTDLEIRWRMLLSSCIPHPTAVMRRAVLERHDVRYRERFDAAEDYDLLVRLLDHAEGANLSEPLLEYRIGTEDKKSVREADRQRRLADRISHRYVSRSFPELGLNLRQVSDLRLLIHGGGATGLDKQELGATYLELLSAFESKYEPHPDLVAVREEATLQLLRALSRPPLRPDSLGLVVDAVRIDPRLPLRFLGYLRSNPEVLTSRIRR
ncbi:glycosyltransferase [Salinirubellus sp. GCM10025818]|uniref:glycosyltransferase n=1 Tax=Salinirubellus TaxID=2162630 RepID=UPI0030D37DC2